LRFVTTTFGDDLFDGSSRNELTGEGDAFDTAWTVYRDRDEAERLLREAYLQLEETSALMQGLHGRKSVPVDGALHLLARHHLADPADVSGFRAYLQVLNDMGIVAYSKKLQTVRVLAPMPAEEDEDTPSPRIRVVERERPYSNILHLRETLRACRGHVWWADPQFSRKGLEPLVHEADASRISEIRILSGPARVGPDAEKDFKRFVTEMENLGITAEWRVVEKPDQDFHDRFIVSRDRAWNVPPIDTLYKGDYSELSETSAPPFAKWWAKGKSLGT
jgi:hypothetical protein